MKMLIIARITHVFSHVQNKNPDTDAQWMCIAAYILWHTKWRHGRSRNKTKYREYIAGIYEQLPLRYPEVADLKLIQVAM